MRSRKTPISSWKETTFKVPKEEQAEVQENKSTMIPEAARELKRVHDKLIYQEEEAKKIKEAW